MERRQEPDEAPRGVARARKMDSVLAHGIVNQSISRDLAGVGCYLNHQHKHDS